jgi:hypothetical protein
MNTQLNLDRTAQTSRRVRRLLWALMLACLVFLPVGAQQTQAASGLQVKVLSAGYEQWGQPVNGCGQFNDRHPMRKFNMNLRVTNNTGRTLTASEWYAYSYVGKKLVQWTCYYPYQGEGFPSIPAGQTRNVTFSAFVEPYESVTSVLVGRKGLWALICFDETQVVRCR